MRNPASGRIASRVTDSSLAALICVAVLAIAACKPAAAPAGPPRPPNVVLLVLDTVRADRCSFLGYTRATTPKLAEIAKGATVYTNAWSPAPWTLPAHGALFTGKRSHLDGIGMNGSMSLDPGEVTLAERMVSAGFATGCFSANPLVASETMLTRGFQLENREPRLGIPEPPPASTMHAKVLAWITTQRASGKPYFAYINDMEAHSPFNPPEAFSALFRSAAQRGAVETLMRSFPQPETVRASLGSDPLTPEQRAVLSDLYDADVAHLDDEVGKFVLALDAMGALDDTLLVITSDHGEGLGDHLWVEHSTIVHQETLRIPLLIRQKGRFPAGLIVKDVVRLEDVFATILDTCGLAVPPGIDGAPLSPRLPAPRLAFASEDAHDEWIPRFSKQAPSADISILRRKRRSVSDGRWHLIVEGKDPEDAAPGSVGGGAVLLFDLDADPLEKADVAKEHPAEVTRLRAALDAELPQ